MNVLLFSLNGKPAPEGMSESIVGVERLPAAARTGFGELLFPNLEPLPEDQLDNRIARLCRRNDLDVEVAGSAIKAVAFLFRSAAAFAIDPDALASDIRAMGGSPSLVELLLPLYEQAVPNLRREIAQAAIAMHGAVLVGIEWRIDTLGASSRGRKLNVPVALMTFQYQESGEVRTKTFQMLPDMVGSLREVCDELLATGGAEQPTRH